MFRPVEYTAHFWRIDMAGKFEVYEDAGGKFRFRLKASNGEVVASGQGYASRSRTSRAAGPGRVRSP
jgi:uncharacterized protein YegP (UPF0339 family)